MSHNSKDISNDFLQKIKIHENIVLENLTEKINENLLFALINIICDRFACFI